MNKTVLSDAQIEKGRESIFSTDNPYCPCDRKTMLKAARWAEQAVLQSPEIQQMRKDAELLSVAVQMLADWCVAVKEGGTGWDYWDEHYKDAAYRDNPLRSLIDAAMEVKP